MRKIVKLKEPLLDRLNLAEYANLLGRIHALTVEEGPEALGVESEAVELLARSLEKLLDAVGRNLAAPETDELERLRLRRVRLGQSIIKAVRAAQEFPHEEIACAGRALYPVLKPCVGFYRLPAAQVTVISAIDDFVKITSAFSVFTNLDLKNLVISIKINSQRRRRIISVNLVTER